MTSQKVRKFLSPESPRGAKNELSFLARLIGQDIGMKGGIWEAKLTQYMERNKSVIPKNKKSRSYLRGNLNSQFTSPNMTWKTFIEYLRFLNPVGIRIKVELNWPGLKEPTVHSITVRAPNDKTSVTPAEIDIALPNKDNDVESD